MVTDAAILAEDKAGRHCRPIKRPVTIKPDSANPIDDAAPGVYSSRLI